jgi:hypothetical protein
MSMARDSARVDHARHYRVALRLSETGIRPKDLAGKYFKIDDALYRDERGWYVVARSPDDGQGRMYFDFDTGGSRIEWN